MASGNPETAEAPKKQVVLLSVPPNDIVMLSTPPGHADDRYGDRAAQVCRIPNIQKITTDWEGKVYIISGGDLYAGPMPISQSMNWYAAAKKVAKGQFSNYQHIFFHPNGDFYGITNEGKMYKGPPPSNQYISWVYDEATYIGGGWQQYAAIFFDVTGTLYAVSNSGQFYRGPVPAPEKPWGTKAVILGNGGWYNLTYFMLPDADGNLWSVSRANGDMFKGPMPTPEDNHESYRKKKCQFMGTNYFRFKFICFSIDKTVHNIISCEFLPERAITKSDSTEVLEEKVYDNRKSHSVLKHTFTIDKSIRQSSSFSHEHGFTFEMGLGMSFRAGLPCISEAGTKVTVSASTTHNWNFAEKNETTVTISSSTNVEVEPGKAIKMTGSIRKAKVDVPYRARIMTLFGLEDNIEGTWKGVTCFNLMVTQENYTG